MNFRAIQRIDRLGIIMIEHVCVAQRQPCQRSGIFFGMRAGVAPRLRRRRAANDPAKAVAPWDAGWPRLQTPAACAAPAARRYAAFVRSHHDAESCRLAGFLACWILREILREASSWCGSFTAARCSGRCGAALAQPEDSITGRWIAARAQSADHNAQSSSER